MKTKRKKRKKKKRKTKRTIPPHLRPLGGGWGDVLDMAATAAPFMLEATNPLGWAIAGADVAYHGYRALAD